jgi:hypothetical protein
MEGVASRVRRNQEGAETVLRFLITAEDGTAANVEMRGDGISGDVYDGDRVTMPDDPLAEAEDGVHRPLRVENQTTHSAVTARRPSLGKRAAKQGPVILSAVTSTGVTFVLGLITAGGEEDASPAAPIDGDGPFAPAPAPGTDWFPFELPGAALVVFGIAALLWLAWFALIGHRWRRRGRRLWPVAVATLVGVSIGLWAFGVTQDEIVG